MDQTQRRLRVAESVAYEEEGMQVVLSSDIDREMCPSNMHKQAPLRVCEPLLFVACFSEALSGPNDLSDQAGAFELSVHPLGDTPNKNYFE